MRTVLPLVEDVPVLVNWVPITYKTGVQWRGRTLGELSRSLKGFYEFCDLYSHDHFPHVVQEISEEDNRNLVTWYPPKTLFAQKLVEEGFGGVWGDPRSYLVDLDYGEDDLEGMGKDIKSINDLAYACGCTDYRIESLVEVDGGDMTVVRLQVRFGE